MIGVSMRVTPNALMFAFLVALTTAEAETHRFTPTSYFNTFSFAHPPVLRIRPGIA